MKLGNGRQGGTHHSNLINQMRDTRQNFLYNKPGGLQQNTGGQIINQNITINYFGNQGGSPINNHGGSIQGGVNT